MDIWYLTAAGVQAGDADTIGERLTDPATIVWVDIATLDDASEAVLNQLVHAHPLAVHDVRERNQVPKVHLYPDHVFLVLHAPERGSGGHVHYVEIDQFIGPRFLITTHGPINPQVDPAATRVEVDAVLNRLRSGRLRPTSGYELSHAVLNALTGRLRTFIATHTREVWQLEQRVTGNQLGDPETFLDEMFRTRHGLLTVRTMAALSREVYGRMLTIKAFGTGNAQRLLIDAVDQFDHLSVMADGQKDYLQGTIEFYQARTNTKMTIAAERLAVIAAVTLPITALSSVLGMNVIVNQTTHWTVLVVLVVIMLVMSAALLVWAKRKGWF